MQSADKPQDIPTDPGVYRWRDKDNRVIYVGKAKNLRNRISSYFSSDLHPRTEQLVQTAQSVDWVIVRNETEALQLEYSWIKEYDPIFNVRYRDDKSYPYLAITSQEEFPRVFVYRGDKRKGVTYFGPFVHTWALRDTLDHLLRVFPMRSCSSGVFRNAKSAGRPCLLAHINRCSAPCVGWITAEEHSALVKKFSRFMSGQTDDIVSEIKQQMLAASDAQDYERASVLRDDLVALERVSEKSVVMLSSELVADVVALVFDDLQTAVQVFSIRSGRVVGQRGFIMENSVESTPSLLATDALMHLYSLATASDIPAEILINVVPEETASIQALLTQARGAKVHVLVPQRGDKRELMETVTLNAQQALVRHKSKRSTDLVARTQALSELQATLRLEDAPLRIECIDVSHTAGTNVVASLVVMEDGIPKKSDYRHFIIENPRDDTASIFEVVSRRFRSHVREEGRYRPNLLVIDGGLPQVNAAFQALTELGATHIAVIGLAKRMEEIWLSGSKNPIILSRSSEALFLLQRIRDEAHRFAITHHRKRRSKSMVDSALDHIPGLGDMKRKSLIKTFGSLKRMKMATVAELETAPGIGPALAQIIFDSLHAIDPQTSAVNLATGEIIEE